MANLDLVGLGVAPINLLPFKVQSNAVRPDDVLGDQQRSLAAVQVAPLDLRPLVVPVGPEHPAELERECNGSWLAQVFVDQDFSAGAVQSGDLDAIGPRVRPVQIPGYPVDRYAVGALHFARQNVLLATAVQVSPETKGRVLDGHAPGRRSERVRAKAYLLMT
jgi:hypothetical protein